jgi:hypothetical protein
VAAAREAGRQAGVLATTIIKTTATRIFRLDGTGPVPGSAITAANRARIAAVAVRADPTQGERWRPLMAAGSYP